MLISSQFQTYITVAEPENACTEVEPTPTYAEDLYATYALVSSSSGDSYNCSIGAKVDNLAEAGYKGAILYFSEPKDGDDEELETRWRRFNQGNLSIALETHFCCLAVSKTIY